MKEIVVRDRNLGTLVSALANSVSRRVLKRFTRPVVVVPASREALVDVRSRSIERDERSA